MSKSAISSDQVAQALELLRDGLMLSEIARELGVRRVTLLHRLKDTPEAANEYARAREDGLDARAEDLEALAAEAVPSTASGGLDSAAVSQLKLRVDARKWILAKLASHKYGDKLAIGGNPDAPPIRTEGTITLTAEEAYKKMLDQ